MRGDLPTVTREQIENMWASADKVPVVTGNNVEKRYNEEYGVLMVTKGNTITTVMIGDYLEFGDDRDPCEWCGKSKTGRESCRKCCGFKLE